MNYLNENTILAFHVGRGGRFNNGGHVTFLGQHSIGDYLDNLCAPVIIKDNEITDDYETPDAQWTNYNGCSVGLTNADIQSGIGRIDEDGEYDTTYTMYLKDIEPETAEWDAVFAETYYEDIWTYLVDYFAESDAVKPYMDKTVEAALAIAVDFVAYEQNVHITSREDIDGEEAELIRFTYGKYDDTCVAVRYNDGTIFVPYDWHTAIWDNEDWKIDDIEWVDARGVGAINLNGMPRLIL